MTEMSKAQIENEINQLECKISGDMFKDMELKDKIHNLKLKLKGVRPVSSEIECVGCGS